LVIAEQAFMLDLEQKNGNHLALPYSSLMSVTLDPSKLLVAHFAGHLVKITGVNLLGIYEALTKRAAGKLVEVGNRPDKPAEGVPLIRTMTVTVRPGTSTTSETSKAQDECNNDPATK
jgi:hypothetical protein